jgi:bla regulator protein blaR1
MPAILIYLLKANIALTLFFLAYRWGLRRLTFYVLNRFFLLSGIVCSSVFPLIDVNNLLENHEEIGEVVAYVPDLSALQAQPGFTVWHLLVYIFWTGVAVMTIRFTVQLSALWRLHRKSHPGLLQEHPVKLLGSRINPFSFFRHIYINPSLHQPSELDAILRHELVHVKEWHTIDVLTAELNNIFYWFNPGAWLMKTAIRENLEFITDRRMLQQGADPKAYQYNLIKVSGIPYATAIANNFNFSHLKNRIKMMNQKRSAKYNLLRYLVLGCVVVIALLSLNFSRAAFHGKQITIVADTVPAPPPPPVPLAPVAPEKKVPLAPPVPEAPGKVPVPAPPPPPVPAPPGEKPVPPTPPTPPSKKVVLDLHAADPANPPLYFVDGVNQGNTKPLELKEEDIEAIYVWKDEKAIQRYGENGRNGVIQIFTKAYKGPKPEARTFSADTVKVLQLRVDTAINVNTNTKVNTDVKVNTNTNVNVKESKNVNVVKVVSAISLKGMDSLHQQQ